MGVPLGVGVANTGFKLWKSANQYLCDCGDAAGLLGISVVGGTVTPGVYQHVVCTWDVNNPLPTLVGGSVRLYVDGIEVATGASDGLLGSVDLAITGPFFIGIGGDAMVDLSALSLLARNPFLGSLDEVALYDTVQSCLPSRAHSTRIHSRAPSLLTPGS